MQSSNQLCPGVELAGKYIVESLISFRDFGVIYKARDKNSEKIVAIKEYYPTTYLSRIAGEKQVNVYDKRNMADFEKGKREFLEEARNLAKFNNHPNIVHINNFFEENGTAYFVMEFLDGCNLKTFLQVNACKGKQISVDTALQITQCVLSALREIHAYKIIHGDINPASIFLCKDGTIRLINLNNNKMHFRNGKKRKGRTVFINPGYTPIEQYYVKSKCGPYTDIYAIAAVLYEMLTGLKPVESIERKVADTLVEPKKINQDIPGHINNAIMKAMSVHSIMRFRNVNQFIKALKQKR